MRVFLAVWAGQTVGSLGAGLTGFAIGVWVFQTTGSVTPFTLILLSNALPRVLILPVSGALVDRLDRRRVLLLSETVSMAATMALGAVVLLGRLELWHVYLSMVIHSVAGGFARPAFTAAVTLIVPREQFARASGMVQTGQAAAGVLSPLLAGALVVAVGLQGVVVVNVVTALCAVGVLLGVRFPSPPVSVEGRRARGSFRQEVTAGWTYISAFPGLLGLLLFFAGANFTLGMAQAVLTPLVLSFSTPEVLGAVLSAGAAGMLAGGVVMSAWGGPRRRIRGVLGFGAAAGAAMMLVGVRPAPAMIAVALFVSFGCVPFMNACSQAIWQTKIPPDIQGRVTAMRLMIGTSTAPLAFAIAGPLVDRVMEPLLLPGGALSGTVGHVLGVGPGRGTGLLVVLMGLAAVAAAALAHASPRVRHVEEEIPDLVLSHEIPVARPRPAPPAEVPEHAAAAPAARVAAQG
jgi:MFS transporter, DHA3 family, macrolide efflux protein